MIRMLRDYALARGQSKTQKALFCIDAALALGVLWGMVEFIRVAV